MPPPVLSAVLSAPNTSPYFSTGCTGSPSNRESFSRLLTFKCLYNMAPAYLCELISRYKPGRTLRSSTLTLLEVPPLPRTVSYGARTFAAQAPSLWNELPEYIHSIDSINHFKKSVPFQPALPVL